MGNAKHIGRIGALAVALGVGMAVANTPAVALAAPADSGTSSSSGAPSPSSSSPDSGSTSSDTSSATSSSFPTNDPPNRHRRPLNPPGEMAESSSGGALTSSTAAATAAGAAPARWTRADAPGEVAAGGPHTSTTTGSSGSTATTAALTPPTSTPSTGPASTTATLGAPGADARQNGAATSRLGSQTSAAVGPAQPNTASPGSGYTPAKTSPTPAGVNAPATDPTALASSLDATRVVADGVPSSASTTPSAAATPGAASAAAPMSSTATAAATAPDSPAYMVVTPTPADPVPGLVSTLVNAVLFPFANSAPTTPVQPPTLWTLLAFVRREFELAFSIPSATVNPLAGQITNGLVTDTAAASLVYSPNLLVNPGAELGDPSLSGYGAVTVPGWMLTGTPTVIQYGTLRRFPWPTASPGPVLPAFLAFPSYHAGLLPTLPSGQQFFGGGPVATSTLTQTVDLRGAASEIDQGNVPYELSGDLGGFTIDPSRASVTVDFLDSNGVKLGTGTIGPVTALDRGFQTGLIHRATSGTIPVGTRSARVVVTLTDLNPVLGNYNNAYADNLSFKVGADLPAPPPPTPPVSTVGALDHVFIIYMENKGVTDIVGSPNAPYINSLINTYGYAANYYALTHPSDPNYYPILGGSDFGINYNCPSNCFDQPNLADNIEAAGKTWAGYAVGGGGYTTPTDRLPFLAFSDIFSDPARVQTHLFDLTQLPLDLASPATTPNFVWIAANDATNMEGPTDTFVGIVQWALSQLTTHQYNVAAGDMWLQDTLPIIMNSPVWQDPTQRSAIFLTFDEDYNNLSTGIGNQGNHIVMVVIPSPGAVASGMLGGSFTALGYYNHYSLLRTIEEALGLPPLTNNDKYAQPMNEFWSCGLAPACGVVAA